MIITRPRVLQGNMWSEFAALRPTHARRKLIKQKISASSSTLDSDPSPLQAYVPTSRTCGPHHRWLLFNWRGEDVVRGGAEGHFGDRSCPGTLWKSRIARKVCGRTDFGCRSSPSRSAQLGACWASDGLLCYLAFLPPHPRSCFVPFPSSLTLEVSRLSQERKGAAFQSVI